MGISVRWLIAIVAAGVLLAAVPILALDRALDSYAARDASRQLAAQARNTLNLAELRLRQATAVLIELDAAGVNGCGPESLEAMRLTVFTTTPLKSVSILDEHGRTQCSNADLTSHSYALSREYRLSDERLALSLVRFRDRDERAARLRLERPDGRSVAVLLATDSLLPASSLAAGEENARVRLILENGEVVVAWPNGTGAAGFDEENLVTVQQESENYPVTVVAERSRNALAGEYRELQALARLAIMLFVGLCVGLVAVGLRRNREDPVVALKKGIKNGEIVPFYQPTVDTRNGRVLGAEVLARWRRPDGTLVSPAHFIPLAEQSGLIYELTRELMRRARDEVGAAFGGRPRLRIGFNLFAGHFADARIVDDIEKIFAGSPLGTGQIVVEVTERAPLHDLDGARQVIKRLQSLGIKVAIDDVGTGHGGLSYLLKLGVDIIKIDKMFVDAISSERYSQTIIETLVDLGRTMNMDVIAEGVETPEQLEYLRLKGVHEAQGYVFAPPLPASSFLALVEAMERPNLSVVASPVAVSGAA